MSYVSVALVAYMAFIGVIAFIGWRHQQLKSADEQYIDTLRDAGQFNELYKFINRTFGPPYYIEHEPTGKTYFLV